MKQNFEVFDIETLGINNILKPYSICYSDKDKYVYTIVDNNDEHFLINLILNNFKDNVIYYAHNLIFDFTFILKSILTLKIKYKWLFLDYQLYEVILIFPLKKIILRCSLKLIPFALKNFYPYLSDKKKTFFLISNS